MGRTKIVLKKFLAILFSLIIITSVAFYVYTLDYYHALPIAMETLSKDSNNYKLEKNMIVFMPRSEDKNKGIVFYPGGKVDYLSYIPLMEKLSYEGFTCFLMKMPFNLAVFKQNAADIPIKEYMGIESWYLSGHSLGGAMASVYTSNNSDKVDGLILMGAYPSADLSLSNIEMISIYGSEDRVLSKESFENNKPNGPKDSIYYKIEGGNHAYYGNYGKQKNDGEATITPEEQQNITVEKIAELINN